MRVIVFSAFGIVVAYAIMLTVGGFAALPVVVHVISGMACALVSLAVALTVNDGGGDWFTFATVFAVAYCAATVTIATLGIVP
jgi:hypothetical protein